MSPRVSSAARCVSLVGLIVVFGCETTQKSLIEEDYKLLSTSELQNKLPDTTVYGEYKSGKTWIDYFSPDGKVVTDERGFVAYGKWLIKQNALCFSYLHVH